MHLRVENADSDFCRHWQSGDVVRMPIAHAEGNYFADQETLKRLAGEGQIAFRYCGPDGRVDDDANPNGAALNIAGITNAKRNVLGLMPHPERLAEAALGGTDGKAMFDSLVERLN